MKKKLKNNQYYKSPYFWILLTMTVIFAFNMFRPVKENEISYSQLIRLSKGGDIVKVNIYYKYAKAQRRNGEIVKINIGNQSSMLANELDGMGVNVQYVSEDSSNLFFALLFNSFPTLLLIGVWVFFAMKMQGGGGPMGFGKSKAKMVNKDENKITFKDVAGIDEAKADISEIVDFLKDPERFRRLGGKIPKGVLLVGHPGTGKTLLAKAVAGEANVPFFAISGSDFVEMFVGVGASRVRDLFAQAKKNSPCLIFIDEIDAVGRHRGAGVGGGNDEREQTLNQLLVEMDGFDTNGGVILIAATNRPDVLDPALLRPGRFDRRVSVSLPVLKGREEILKVHVKDVKLDKDVDLNILAKGTPGFSGANLANLVNEAALNAARNHKRKVAMSDFDCARDRIILGTERKGLVMKPEELKRTAYHEAGHALVQIYVGDVDPIYKATIVPTGFALGAVHGMPDGDKISKSKASLLGDIAVAYGGRIAEEEFFGLDSVTTGASNDIMQATKMARSMVTEWGLSDLGPIMFEEKEEEVFLGHSMGQKKNVSEDTAAKIDHEVKKILDEGYNTAKNLITMKKDKMKLLAESLLKYETLSGQEIQDLLDGKEINPQLRVVKSKAPVKKSLLDDGNNDSNDGSKDGDNNSSDGNIVAAKTKNTAKNTSKAVNKKKTDLVNEKSEDDVKKD